MSNLKYDGFELEYFDNSKNFRKYQLNLIKKFYKNHKDMMEHIQRFNDHNINFLVFGRKVGKKFISLNKINVPKIIEDRCTGFEEDSFRDDISSTELRLTQNN